MQWPCQCQNTGSAAREVTGTQAQRLSGWQVGGRAQADAASELGVRSDRYIAAYDMFMTGKYLVYSSGQEFLSTLILQELVR